VELHAQGTRPHAERLGAGRPAPGARPEVQALPQAAWYSVVAVVEKFECGRCHLEQVPDRQSWFARNEPVWSYGLAEVLYQFLEHDGELAVLAVHDEFAPSDRPLAHGFELELTPPHGEGVELDIFSADGYRLWVGEAKTSGRFESGRLGAPYFGATWFSRTTDGGQTWEPARPIFDPGGNSQTIGNQIVVLPDGT
jgi:hypothetical protein